MTREEREDAIKFFEEVAKKEINNAKYSKLAIEALEQQPVTTTNNDEPITVIYPTIVCDDAISRQAVLNILFYKSDNNGEVRLSKELRDRIKNLPPVTRQTGEWIHLRCDMYECSKCRKIYTSFEKGECDAFYCPKCGARMVEPQKSEVSSEKDSN